MAKQLSQAEIDALLTSLRRAQEEAEAAGGGASSAHASGAGWDLVGEPLAAALADLMAGAWRQHIPGISIVRGEGPPAGTAPGVPTRVVRLGAPLVQRVWFFWNGAAALAPAAIDGFLAELEAVLPATWTHQTLGQDTPFPDDGVLLPFRGVTADQSVDLALGLEGHQLKRLEERLAGTGFVVREAGAPAPRAGSSSIPIAELEVEASVYVGGGVYRLSHLTGLRPGAVLPLATEVGEPAVVAIGSRVIAYGEVMVTADDTLAVRLTRVLLGDEGRTAAPAWLEQGKRDREGAQHGRGIPGGDLPPNA